MIYIETAQNTQIERDRKEILHYLGYGKNAPTKEVMKRIETAEEEIFSSLSCRACFLVCDIKVADRTIDFGTFSVTSSSLAKNLQNCRQAVLFCATIGAVADRVIAKYSRLSPSQAVIAQAAGTVAIEKWCDLFEKRLSKTYQAEDKFLRPRFSPGYGDFSIRYQKDLFSALACSKHIGVSLTDSLMMTPTKSVSAVIGIGSEQTNCHKGGCENCENRENCVYARG